MIAKRVYIARLRHLLEETGVSAPPAWKRIEEKLWHLPSDVLAWLAVRVEAVASRPRGATSRPRAGDGSPAAASDAESDWRRRQLPLLP